MVVEEAKDHPKLEYLVHFELSSTGLFEEDLLSEEHPSRTKKMMPLSLHERRILEVLCLLGRNPTSVRIHTTFPERMLWMAASLQKVPLDSNLNG